MEVNQPCFRFEPITYQEGLLDKEVDATYILHLDGNGRLPLIREQLKKYHPTKMVYIVFNRGFKKCAKHPDIRVSRMDIIDGFLQIFRHAQEHHYGNVLVLEDDFMFDERILEPVHTKNVCDFLADHADEEFVYYLGVLPFIQYPYGTTQLHYKLVLSGGTHACIYSEKNRTKTMGVDAWSMDDWDLYNNYHSTRYAYYLPLCYQLFPDTENSSQWVGLNTRMVDFDLFLGRLGIQLLQWFGLDTQVEPGYPFFYGLSKVLFYLVVILAGYILYILCYTVAVTALGTMPRREKSKRTKISG